MTTISCESCGNPMVTEADHAPGHPDSTYCHYCSTPAGDLQSFEERFTRMTQWEMRQRGSDQASAEAATRAYMRAMPVWRDHPALREG